MYIYRLHAYACSGMHAGAGKTTLLDILACREKRGTIGGDVILGQQPFNRRLFKQLGGCLVGSGS